MRIKLAEIIAATGGCSVARRLQSNGEQCRHRQQGSGAGQFVCGFARARADGHDFVADSARAGAVAALVQRDVEAPPGFVTVRVPDTLLALQRLAGGTAPSLPACRLSALRAAAAKPQPRSWWPGA